MLPVPLASRLSERLAEPLVRVPQPTQHLSQRILQLLVLCHGRASIKHLLHDTTFWHDMGWRRVHEVQRQVSAALHCVDGMIDGKPPSF